MCDSEEERGNASDGNLDVVTINKLGWCELRMCVSLCVAW